MIQFYIQIGLQVIFFGLALYFYITTSFKVVTIGGTWSKISNFFIAHMFLLAMICIGFYWYDTVETKNTLFSEPNHKFIETKVKK
jgi:hypothetical protein